MQKEARPQLFVAEEITQKPIAKGFRACCELSQPGRYTEGNIKTDQYTSLMHLNVEGIPCFNLFGVLDSHGLHGYFVSQHCKEQFIRNISNYTETLKLINGLTDTKGIYIELKKTKFNYIIELQNQVDTEYATQDNFYYNLRWDNL